MDFSSSFLLLFVSNSISQALSEWIVALLDTGIDKLARLLVSPLLCQLTVLHPHSSNIDNDVAYALLHTMVDKSFSTCPSQAKSTKSLANKQPCRRPSVYVGELRRWIARLKCSTSPLLFDSLHDEKLLTTTTHFDNENNVEYTARHTRVLQRVAIVDKILDSCGQALLRLPILKYLMSYQQQQQQEDGMRDVLFSQLTLGNRIHSATFV